jgi:hypothetical protein
MSPPVAVPDDGRQPGLELTKRARLLWRGGRVPLTDIGERPHRRQVLGSAPHHLLELTLRVVEQTDVGQGAAERQSCREIAGMLRKPCAADADGFLMVTGAPVFLGELREGKRRRILTDPAPQFFDPLTVGHATLWRRRSAGS